MSSLQRNFLRAIVAFTISLGLISSPVLSLRLGYAVSNPAQSLAESRNAPPPQ